MKGETFVSIDVTTGTVQVSETTVSLTVATIELFAASSAGIVEFLALQVITLEVTQHDVEVPFLAIEFNPETDVTGETLDKPLATVTPIRQHQPWGEFLDQHGIVPTEEPSVTPETSIPAWWDIWTYQDVPPAQPLIPVSPQVTALFDDPFATIGRDIDARFTAAVHNLYADNPPLVPAS
jgi:hypothetical protein